MVEFFYCADGSVTVDKHLAGVPVLITTAFCFNRRTRKFRVPNGLENAEHIFIDSGGFSYLKDREYPFTLDEYITFLQAFVKKYPGKVKAVATPDYPCAGQCDVKDNIERTLENAWAIVDGLNPFERDIEWYITIHGKTYEDYRHACERFYDFKYQSTTDYLEDCQEDGEEVDEARIALERAYFDYAESDYRTDNYHIAIGSLKAKKNPLNIVRILRLVKSLVPGDCKVHAFGLGLSYLKDPAVLALIDSADSGAWRGHCPVGVQEKVNNFKDYKVKVDAALAAPVSGGNTWW